MWWMSAEGIDRETYLDITEIDEDWDTEIDASEYTVSCSHFTMKSWISYNTTLYNSTLYAWDNDDLHILFAIDFEELGSRWDIFSLITGVLFLQLPDVHPLLNMFIAIPLWICIVWLTFAFIIANEPGRYFVPLQLFMHDPDL